MAPSAKRARVAPAAPLVAREAREVGAAALDVRRPPPLLRGANCSVPPRELRGGPSFCSTYAGIVVASRIHGSSGRPRRVLVPSASVPSSQQLPDASPLPAGAGRCQKERERGTGGQRDCSLRRVRKSLPTPLTKTIINELITRVAAIRKYVRVSGFQLLRRRGLRANCASRSTSPDASSLGGK